MAQTARPSKSKKAATEPTVAVSSTKSGVGAKPKAKAPAVKKTETKVPVAKKAAPSKAAKPKAPPAPKAAKPAKSSETRKAAPKAKRAPAPKKSKEVAKPPVEMRDTDDVLFDEETEDSC